jgi:alkanesulfonate monooxygenase SsuD/methylene tetrahydromethanopterin reductase-like flavin-dependent oxidoreductase (luciferase family)
MDEMIAILRGLARGGFFAYRGKHYEIPSIKLCPAPTRPIPILIGGHAEPALRRAARLGDGWIGTGQSPDEARALLGRLRALRSEAGRASLPFEAIVPLSVPPDRDVLRSLAADGMTATTAWPFSYTIGPRSTIQQKRDAMRRFGDEVIAKLS